MKKKLLSHKKFLVLRFFLFLVASIPLFGRNEPWLTESAIEFLKEFFEQKPNATVLEFGSGASTLWIAERTTNLYSVENCAGWYNKITNLLSNGNYNKVDYLLKETPYYNVCDQFPDNFFDLVIVDGRNRKGCIAHSIPKLKPGGILMLDNAERRYYHPVFSLMEGWEHFSAEQTKPDKFGFWYAGWKTDWWIKN